MKEREGLPYPALRGVGKSGRSRLSRTEEPAGSNPAGPTTQQQR